MAAWRLTRPSGSQSVVSKAISNGPPLRFLIGIKCCLLYKTIKGLWYSDTAYKIMVHKLHVGKMALGCKNVGNRCWAVCSWTRICRRKIWQLMINNYKIMHTNDQWRHRKERGEIRRREKKLTSDLLPVDRTSAGQTSGLQEVVTAITFVTCTKIDSLAPVIMSLRHFPYTSMFVSTFMR